MKKTKGIITKNTKQLLLLTHIGFALIVLSFFLLPFEDTILPLTAIPIFLKAAVGFALSEEIDVYFWFYFSASGFILLPILTMVAYIVTLVKKEFTSFFILLLVNSVGMLAFLGAVALFVDSYPLECYWKNSIIPIAFCVVYYIFWRKEKQK